MKSKQNTPKGLRKEDIEELARELDEIANDPEMLEEAERHHREVSYISPEDLLKRFIC